MKDLYLYKAVAPRDPKTGKVAGIKHASLDTIAYIGATAVIVGLTLWALWALHIR